MPVNNLDIKVEAPSEFPTEEVMNATRRPVEIIEEADVTDSQLSNSNANDDSDAPVQEALVEEAGIAEVADQTQTASAESTRAQPLTTADNRLAEQTVTSTPSIREDAGWVVQLGSFRHQKNVNELLDKLDAAGYRAFSRRVDTSAGRLTKVFVGPELTKETLDNALPHLNEATGLKGKVTSFAEATN